MTTMNQLIREDLRNFQPYRSARLEGGQGNIFLNANELPWNTTLNRYPNQQPAALIKELARYYAVERDQLLVTRGSDEGIDLLVRLFCQYGQDSLLVCPPTFGMYAVAAKLQGIDVVEVALKLPSYDCDFESIESCWNQTVKLIFLCSPNNPTGNVIENKMILSLCQQFSGKAIIVVDEAYIEFSQTKSIAQYVADYDNLVVLRTLSKAFGLAAARIGILIANSEIVTWLKKILAPYPLPSLSVRAALAVFHPAQQKERELKIDIIRKEREQLYTVLTQLKCVESVWPTQANFVLVKFTKPIEELSHQGGFVLRNMEQKIGMGHVVRVTVGTPEENSKLIALLNLL